MNYLRSLLTLAALLLGPVTPAQASSSLTTLPRFIEPTHWAVGFEPELAFSQNASLAGVAKFTYGLSDWNNAQLFLGNGVGDRGFRAGTQLTADIFPDYDGQPGIGFGGSVTYSRQASLGELALSAYPYLHKSLSLKGANEIEPYLALPVGITFVDGKYLRTSQLILGALFQNTRHFRYSFEIGMAINNTDSFLAGGVTYYHDAP